MARKFLNKKIVSTRVNGFILGDDGAPVPHTIVLAGRYSKEKAAKEIRKHHTDNFMVSGVELAENFYRIALDDFIKFAEQLTAEQAAAAVEGETEQDDNEPAEPAKKARKSGK